MLTYLFLFAVVAENWLLTYHLKRLFLLLLQMEGNFCQALIPFWLLGNLIHFIGCKERKKITSCEATAELLLLKGKL